MYNKLGPLLISLGVLLGLSGCTVSRGVVKDIHTDATGNLVMQKCDVKSYFAFYGLIAADENCHDEPISNQATQARR